MRIITIALLLVSIAAIWIAAFSFFGRLPERIPLHFDFSGTPDRWGPPSFGNWFLLPILATAIPGVLIGIGSLTHWLLNHYPSIVNIPRKEKLLLLDPPARQRAIRSLTMMMYSIALILSWLFLYLIVGTAQVALGAWSSLPVWPVFVQVPAILGVVLWNHWSMVRAIDAEFSVAQLDRH